MKGLPTQPFTAVRRQSKRLIAGIPFDLVVVVSFAAVATALVSVLEISSPLVRAAVGIPLLFFVPGYVIVSVLFPRATPVENRTAGSRLRIRQLRDLSDVERAALSFGTSFALLPLLGLAIAQSSWPLSGPVVVSAVTCFAAFWAVVATVRRLLVPAPDRYRVGFRRRFGAVRTAMFGGESTLYVAVNVALVCSMVIALTAIGYGLVSPQHAEEYTDMQLLTENESGELVASGYSEEIESGESAPLAVAIDNREGEAMTYTVVVQEQRLEDGEVVERTELQRYDTQIADGESDRAELTVTPTTDDGDVRVSAMVFTDDVPETPTTDDAYRYGHVWTSTAADADLGADTDLESDDDEGESDESADESDDSDDETAGGDGEGDEDEADDEDDADEDESDAEDEDETDDEDEVDGGDETDDEDEAADEDETDDEDEADEEDETGDDETDDEDGADDEDETGDETDDEDETDTDSDETDDEDDGGIFDFGDGDDEDDDGSTDEDESDAG